MDEYIRRMREQQEIVTRAMEGPAKYIRRMREQQEIVTRAMEGPAKYIRENQTAVTRMQDLVRRMDVAAASLVTPGSVNTLERYAREQRQIHETTERLALPLHAWMREVAEMSTLIKATQSTLPTIDFRRVGDLIGAANLQRDAVARLTDRLLFSHADLIESISQPAGRPPGFRSSGRLRSAVSRRVHTHLRGA